MYKFKKNQKNLPRTTLSPKEEQIPIITEPNKLKKKPHFSEVILQIPRITYAEQLKISIDKILHLC